MPSQSRSPKASARELAPIGKLLGQDRAGEVRVLALVVRDGGIEQLADVHRRFDSLRATHILDEGGNRHRGENAAHPTIDTFERGSYLHRSVRQITHAFARRA